MRAVAIALVALAGCSSWIEQRAASTTYKIMERGSVAARRMSDVTLAREAAPGGIVQAAAFAAAYPDHRGFKALHAESLCQYTIGFVFDDWEDASLGGRDDEARHIAERLEGLLAECIALNRALLPRAFASGDRAGWAALLPSVRREHVPALLWIASADAVTIAIDPMRGLALLARTIATLERCIALAPGSRDADGELLLGTLLAGRSRFFGGPDGTAQLAAARRFLGKAGIIVDVMFARALAVARQDRALFVTTLNRALATDAAQWPDRRLANELARRKAKRYLAASERLIASASR